MSLAQSGASLLFLRSAPCAFERGVEPGEERGRAGETDDCHVGESCWPVHSCETPVYPAWQGAKTVPHRSNQGADQKQMNIAVVKLHPASGRMRAGRMWIEFTQADVSSLPPLRCALSSKQMLLSKNRTTYATHTLSSAQARVKYTNTSSGFRRYTRSFSRPPA